MGQREWSVLHHDAELQLDALHANFTTHSFARHWHDYYVVGLVEAGAQSFWCRRATHLTPRGGLILLNPGEPHTGQAAAEAGFGYRALYPTVAHMAGVMAELGRRDELPRFPAVRVDDPTLAAALRALHNGFGHGEHTPIERETHWLSLLAALVLRYGADTLQLPSLGAEPRPIQRARDYLEEHYAERVTLAELATHTGLSPFHLVRSFRRATGLPPHAYLESVRIRRAQQQLAAGTAPADVAYATGFSSQSHLTSRFRQIIGVTPGRYQAERARL